MFTPVSSLRLIVIVLMCVCHFLIKITYLLTYITVSDSGPEALAGVLTSQYYQLPTDMHHLMLLSLLPSLKYLRCCLQ